MYFDNDSFRQHFVEGRVFAYPTEAVFGLGCDPLNESAVYEILRLKQRDSWPGPVTWLIPKLSHTPTFISGDSDMIAVRVTTHPLVQQMCWTVNRPLISTSANPASKTPAKSSKELKQYFGDDLIVIDGALGEQQSPSKIINSLNMEIIRA